MNEQGCGFPGCPGMHWKFGTCLVEALYGVYASMHGAATEECGDVDWGLYAWLIIEPDTFTIKADEWDGHADMTVAGPLYAVMTTTSQGFVYLVTEDTESDAQHRYDEIEHAFGQWLEQSEE